MEASELNDQRPDSPFQSDSSTQNDELVQVLAQDLENLVLSCNNDNIDEEIQVMEVKDDVIERNDGKKNVLEDDLTECRVSEEKKGDHSEIGGQNVYDEVDDGDNEEEFKDNYQTEIKNGDYSGEIGGYGWSGDGNAGGDWGSENGGGGSVTVPDDDDDDGRLKTYHYPLRPDAEDCSYYIRTGMCKYGSNCKFNHPLRKRNQPNREIKKQREDNNHMEKPGQIECKFYLSGGCKYGKACKFNHGSRGKTVITPLLEYNFLGLPIRPGEKECPYYMRNGSCKYGSSCRFNHPDPNAVGGKDFHPPTTYGNEAHVPLQNTSQPNMRNMTNMPSWSAPRTPDHPAAAFVPMMYPPTQNIPPPNQDWNGYQAPVPAAAHVYPSSERGLLIPPAFFLNNPPSDTNLYTHHQQQQMLVSDYPERPGQPECSYFMKTGDCKYRSGCKFHHPKSHIARTAPSVLSDKGLPLRPDQNICTHYSRYGICKYGPACKYDHPVSYSSSAAVSGGGYRSDGGRPLIQQSV